MNNEIIKPIQTVYKGYKFRSRLEARWAVFFDALGIEWQYEPEGYQLPDGTWYLPDFYLPEFSSTIEIKPINYYSKILSKPHVYMAGSMKSGDGWRGIGVTDRENRNGCGYESNHLFIYCGPFSASCDHGCAHSNPHLHFSCMSSFDNKSRLECLSQSLRQISMSDIFAIYFNRQDLYGSLVEIGYAKAQGKTIWFGMSKDVYDLLKKPCFYSGMDHKDDFLHDLWFAQQCADEYVICDKADARKEFDNFLIRRQPEEVRQAIMMGENHYVLYGDPVEYKTITANRFDAAPFCNEAQMNKMAAIKARQARFEHGETPL